MQGGGIDVDYDANAQFQKTLEASAMKIGLEIALGAGGAVVLVLVLWNVRFQWELRKHKGMSRASFLAYFTERGISADVAAAVYDYYRSQAIWRTFGISPQDEIAKLFNQDEDDFENDFEVILKRLGLSVPADEAWDARKEPPVKTAEDFVRVVAWASQHQPA
ncbi:MAG: hypothetical protein JO041_08800 [Acidobacteria bacterium]|nr:hypothetical protein [Acidobacteriota bacterium]